MATAQLNVRLDSMLKAEGDLAFSRVGYSPTEVVRLLWDFARRNATDLAVLRALLHRLEADGDAASHRDEVDVAEQTQQMRAELYERIGIPLQSGSEAGVSASLDDLQRQVEQDALALMEAYAQRAAEREI